VLKAVTSRLACASIGDRRFRPVRTVSNTLEGIRPPPRRAAGDLVASQPPAALGVPRDEHRGKSDAELSERPTSDRRCVGRGAYVRCSAASSCDAQ
jgi:hypothetical protein